MHNSAPESVIYRKGDIPQLEGFERRRMFVARATRRLMRGIYKMHFQGDEKILEIGSGIGFLYRHFPEHKGVFIQTDYVASFLKEARKRSPEGTYAAGSVYKLPFKDESFDVVLGLNAYDNFPALEEAIKETARVLKPGGLFLHMMDLLPNSEVLEAKFPGNLGVDENPHAYFSDRLVTAVSSSFNPRTIKQNAARDFVIDHRTNEQRRTRAFFFANFAGILLEEHSAVDHDFEDLGIPKLPWFFRYYELIIPLLERVVPVARIFESPGIEVSSVSYVLAQK